MSLDVSVARPNGSPIDLRLETGKPQFLVGRNGSGKSSLLSWLLQTLKRSERRFLRLRAQRKIWTAGAASSMNAQQSVTIAGQDNEYAAMPHSRWSEVSYVDETGLALFQIAASISERARSIAKAVDADDMVVARAEAAKNDSLMDVNDLLRGTGIPITLTFDGASFSATQGSTTYDASMMSDGERNLLFMAGRVLNAKPDTIIVIDEPERHLHRSIIKPMIAALMKKRPDCLFVIATHELDLSTEFAEANTLLVRSCTFAPDASPTAWDADLLAPNAEFDEDTKRDILGARRKIIYCEGKPHSLDQPLFTLLFPEASVIAKDNCREVEKAVKGVRSAHAQTWVKAFGIIDNDGRPAAELAVLQAEGVFALTVSTVECLYYYPTIVGRMAVRQAANIGCSSTDLLNQAKRVMLAEIGSRAEDLAAKVATHQVRALVALQLPKEADVKAGIPVALNIPTAPIVAAAKTDLDSLLSAADWAGVVERFGVRGTGAMGKIAAALRFATKTDYESAVRQMLRIDAAARRDALAFFGGLEAALAAA